MINEQNVITKQAYEYEQPTLQTFNEAMDSVKVELEKLMDSSPSLIRAYTDHLKQSQGKFIRAVSLLVCAQNKDGGIHPNAIVAAACIELIHLATLVHDDVIDNAKTRRGIETLQKKFGKRTAVICGDYLFCLALSKLSEISKEESYLELPATDYVTNVCLGELRQHMNNGNLNLSVHNYLKIISGKTAALFEASFFGGAIFSGEEQKDYEKYKKLGHYIGMIFQLTDDCLDYEVTSKVAHKPVQSDYEQGVITLPLIYSMRQSDSFREQLSKGLIVKEKIKEFVMKLGGLDYTHGLAKKYYDKAALLIGGMDISSEKEDRLTMILDKAYYGLKPVPEH